ncbi:MAG TPA: LapA family protein [Coprothermobacter sp.]|nr:LapA family protein [Coprothermobacter sp.]
MAGTILLILVIAVAAVVFGMQNTVPLTINFLFWSFQGSAALILVISMLLGVILGILLVTPSFNARGRTIKSLRDDIKRLEEEKSKLQEELNLTRDLLKAVKPETKSDDGHDSKEEEQYQ